MTVQTVQLERRSNLRRWGELPPEPVVLPHATRAWPALERWTPEYLKIRVGHRWVTVDGVQLSVLQLLDLIERSTPARPAPYLRAQKLVDVFPELTSDVEPMFGDAGPNWAERRLLPPSVRRTRLPEILVGGAGAGFHVLHYDKDYLHAFLSQIYGCKQLFLLSPEQSDHLYPLASPVNQSAVDIHAPDLARHPCFAAAEILTTTLLPGETVYIPPGWWHTTLMHETSISLTWNMLDNSNWDAFAAATRRRVTARTNPGVGLAFAGYAAVFRRALRRRQSAGWSG